MRLAAVCFLNNTRLGNSTLNFGGQYFYNIEFLKDTITIKRSRNSEFIDQFFNDKISLISTIVGQNGSGKTTILKHIKNINQKAFFIYEHNDDIYIDYRKNNGVFKLEESFTPLLKIAFEKDVHFNNRILLEIEEHIEIPEETAEKISEIKYFYYSVLSNYNYELKEIDDFIIKDHDNDIINIKNGIILRQIHFLFNLDLIGRLKDIYNDFPSYNSLTIEVKDKFINDFKIHDSRKFDKENNTDKEAPDDYQSFFFELNKLYKNATSPKIRVFVSLYYRFLYSFITNSNYSKAKIIGDLNEEFSQAKKNIENDTISIDLFKRLIKAFETSIDFNSTNIEQTLDLLIFNIDQFVGIKNFKDIEFNGLSQFMKSYFELLAIIENNRNNDNKLLSPNFLIFKPNKQLSLGEESLLNFFSSIYDNKGILCKTVILLLDEPELGFHPEWKKKFINSTVKILPELYHEINKEITDIQIIFTTHDPLTLSDIPNSNIIYLSKMINNKLSIVDKNNKDKTFATNINDLLSNSFFLNNELIGDFAKEKIELIILKLNYFKLLKDKMVAQNNLPEKFSNKEIKLKIDRELRELNNKYNVFFTSEDIKKEFLNKDIFKTINLIGEPVIKYKLLEMYEEVFIPDEKERAKYDIQKIMNEYGLTKNDF